MLRYKTQTSPGLVALYDIRTGNGVGLFLQPRSPHGERGRQRNHEFASDKADAIGDLTFWSNSSQDSI